MESDNNNSNYFKETIKTYLYDFEVSKRESKNIKYHKLYRLFEFLNLECIDFINEHIKLKNVIISKISEIEKELDNNLISSTNDKIELEQINDIKKLFDCLKPKLDIKE